MSWNGRSLAGVAALLLLVGVIAWVSGVRLSPRSPEQRLEAASELLEGIHVTPTVTSVSLVAGARSPTTSNRAFASSASGSSNGSSWSC